MMSHDVKNIKDVSTTGQYHANNMGQSLYFGEENDDYWHFIKPKKKLCRKQTKLFLGENQVLD